MTNKESGLIYAIAFTCLGCIGLGIYILVNFEIRNADVGNDKLAFGLIIASIIPFLLSLNLIIWGHKKE